MKYEMKYDMKYIDDILEDVPIPKMLRVKQVFDQERIKDIPKGVRDTLNVKKIKETIKPGMRIAVTCGSRGIANLPLITREVIAFIKELGANPFIIPAMGSHGGATHEGQRSLIEKKGITEEYCGCPILSSMKVKEIGKIANGDPVFIDHYASESDGIIVVGRIKPHTDFKAKYESGLLKMMAVGLGKHKGAENVHKYGPEFVAERVEQIGIKILECAPILFGVGIVENAYDETMILQAFSKNEILEGEPKLLQRSYGSMAHILFHSADLLIVDEIGKEISGIGADSNITGRFCTNCIKEEVFKASKLVFLDLSKATDGCAVGVGLSDIITERLFQKIDFSKTYVNSITTTVLSPSKIPIIMRNDILAIKLGIYTSNCENIKKIKVIRIKNTLDLSEIYISEELIPEARKNINIEMFKGELRPMIFDNQGNLTKQDREN